MEQQHVEVYVSAPSPMTTLAKRRPTLLPVVCLTAMLGVTGVSQAQDTRILPLGDSITHGVGGQCSYRKPLSQTLNNTPGCSVEFVGPRSTPVGNPAACRPTNTNHAGKAGRRADEANKLGENSGLPFVTELMNDYTPDVVLLHLGTNDLFQGQQLGDASVPETLADLDAVLDNIFATNPSTQVMLANVIPWNGASTSDPAVSSNPLKDRFVQLGTGISQIAAARDQVSLVDVQSGFDPARLTFDAIHPNEAGDTFIADRFASALTASGLCEDADTPSLPALTLVNDRWAQIGLPAAPGSANTVGDIFDELPASAYAQSWVVFRYDSLVNRYEQLGWSSPMTPGEAYWVVQRTGRTVTVSMPTTATPTPVAPSAQCPSGEGCFALELTESDQQPTRTWNMVGFPFGVASTASESRFVSPGGNCADGCTQAQATRAGIVSSPIFHYVGEDSSEPYARITGNASLDPWSGYWVAVPKSAAGNSPTWLLPR